MTEASRTGSGDLSRLGKVSVLVPAHNEAGNIGQVIERSLHSLESLGLAGEVIVVNDGSTDATGPEAMAWAEQDERVRVFSHRVNLGLTAALRTGVSAGQRGRHRLSAG